MWLSAVQLRNKWARRFPMQFRGHRRVYTKGRVWSRTAAQNTSLDTLVRAYPAFLESPDETTIIWKDETPMPVGDGRSGKSFEEKLRHPSILDQLSIPYIRGRLEKPPDPQYGPGFRNIAFFDRMYGDCSRGEVQRKLTTIGWLPKSGGGFVQITTVKPSRSKNLPFRLQGRLTAARSKTPATAACTHGAPR